MAQDGAVDSPSIIDMASCMHAINSGGIKGLRLLGLLPAVGKATIAQIHSGLAHWIALVETYFTPDQLTAWHWDLIAAENSLCKIKRLGDQIGLIVPL